MAGPRENRRQGARPGHDQRPGLKGPVPVPAGARGRALHVRRRRHRSARGRRRLDPRLRLRALYGRHAVLHRRHGPRGLRGAGAGACGQPRPALRPAGEADRNGGKGPDVLRNLRREETGGVSQVLTTRPAPPAAMSAGFACAPSPRRIRSPDEPLHISGTYLLAGSFSAARSVSRAKKSMQSNGLAALQSVSCGSEPANNRDVNRTGTGSYQASLERNRELSGGKNEAANLGALRLHRPRFGACHRRRRPD